MRYISLFSGIEAATLAWEPLGWDAVAFAEIEPFPSAVLAERWPDVPNLGDVTKVDWSKYRGAVDLIVGGSPCQAFSVAGKREGLMDTRGQLMLEYVRAVAEVRPRWFLWENVPGVLSQDRGRAFGTLLREMDELGYGMAWRVLDAQFFGVAQRRRRVFLVGHLGGGAGAAAAVLFEPESVSGNTQTSKQKREALAADARGRSHGAGGGCLTPWDVQSKQIFTPDSCGPTLNAGGNNWNPKNVQPCILDSAHSGCLTPWDVQSKRIYHPDACGPTLPSGTNEGVNIQPSVLAFAQNTRDEVRIQGDGTISGALAAQPGMKQQTYVMESAGFCGYASHTAKSIGYEDELAPTLKGNDWQIQVPNVLLSACVANTPQVAVDEVAPTTNIDGRARADAEPAVLASGQAHAENVAAWAGPHADGAALGAVTSNGADVFPSLCATDGSKQFIDNQSVDGGRLVLDPRQERL